MNSTRNHSSEHKSAETERAGYTVRPAHNFTAVLFFIIFVSTLVSAQRINAVADNKSIEQKLMEWLRYQQNHNQTLITKRYSPPAPTITDLRYVAVNWPRLSEGFKKIYLELQEIPSDFLMHATPRFGIELYYTLNGPDAVDSTDTLSPSTDNCCIFTSGSNGIPDYIDFTGGALDSAWYMEVVKFGFPAPKPFISESHPSSTFKVVVKSLGTRYYGLTFPVENENDTGSGIASLIAIRSNWTGWPNNGRTDYQTHPEVGIRITCAHELFHAIQYRMVHDVVDAIHLDTLPVAWIEATAGMMEELAFPDADDYIQYVHPYFTDPTNHSVFSATSDNATFSDVVICLYLNKLFSTSKSGIGFFRSVFLDNMANQSSFANLLNTASAKENRSWVNILNEFHAASFFTGKRSVHDQFISDADKLPEWTYITGEGSLSESVEKTLKPYSMQYCSILNENHKDGMLEARIILPGARDPGMYAGCIILRRASMADSVVPFTPRLSDTSMVTIKKWQNYDDALVIVSNGTDSTTLSVFFDFSVGPATLTHPVKGPSANQNTAHPTILRLDGRVITTTPGAASSVTGFNAASGLYFKRENTGYSTIIIKQ